MVRVIAFLAAILAAALGLSWLADNPGSVHVEWPVLNIRAEPSVFQVAIALLALLAVAWVATTLVRQLWNGPASVGQFLYRRRQQRGLDSLSNGMIAIGAGDPSAAARHAILARKALPNEPLTHLLRAQAAQLSGDKATSRRIFEGMLASPDTEPLGLRGLFTEASRENEPEAARQFAERALKLNPKLAWASTALFDMQCKGGDWDGALETLASARRNDLVERPLADRRRAVLLTGLAIKAEDGDPNRALALATEAHGLAPDLIPAASLAGRMLASRGNTGKAAKILQKTWARCPHPDLATAYAFARIGDSPRDRLDRMNQLAALNPHSIESAIAVANAAIDAKLFDEARAALAPNLESNLTQRVATLMARIESEQYADRGRVREWLARAVNAPRDPVWTADGVVSEEWAPVSPVTGQLDAFHWRVPVEAMGGSDHDLIARRSEELVALGAPRAAAVDEAEVTVETAPARSSAKPGLEEIAEMAPVNIKVSEPATRVANVAEAKPVPSKPAVVETVRPAAKLAESVTAGTGREAAAAAVGSQASASAAAAKPVAVAPVAAPAAGKPVAAPASSAKTAADAPAKGGKEPRIFVVPHAPDDPGTDTGDAEAPAKGTRPPYRAVP